MKIQTNKKIGGIPVTIIVRGEAECRISDRHFKGYRSKVAGNLKIWNSLYEFLCDEYVIDMMIDDAKQAYDVGSKTNSFFIDMGDDVGWSSTDHIQNYKEDLLEEFKPNKRSRALRVKSCFFEIKAPRTTLVTIVYELRRELHINQVVLVIHSIYPGMDIGELTGNVSARERVAFFGLNHPGQ